VTHGQAKALRKDSNDDSFAGGVSWQQWSDSAGNKEKEVLALAALRQQSGLRTACKQQAIPLATTTSSFAPQGSIAKEKVFGPLRPYEEKQRGPVGQYHQCEFRATAQSTTTTNEIAVILSCLPS
jgi:hypothetical protein